VPYDQLLYWVRALWKCTMQPWSQR
jgi:hypothetical protein